MSIVGPYRTGKSFLLNQILAELVDPALLADHVAPHFQVSYGGRWEQGEHLRAREMMGVVGGAGGGACMLLACERAWVRASVSRTH